MKVGMLRYDTYMPRGTRNLYALANLYTSKNVEFFYFTPDKVDTERKTIRGIFFESEQYVEKETSYPDIIDDIYSFKFKDATLYKELSKYCLFTFTPLQGKNTVYNILKKHEDCSKYLIDTHFYKDIDIEQILKEYGTAIIKPNKGNQGKNVYKIHKNNDMFSLSFDNTVRHLTNDEFTEEYSTKFKKGYLIQPYIKSLTNQGNPFDIRINVRRGAQGKWSLIKIFARIGEADSIVSNVHHGGSIGFIKDFGANFLEAQFADSWEGIYKELLYIAHNFPDILQKGYENMLDDLGFDVGINRANNNELKFFEVNVYTAPIFWESAAMEARFHYYLYLYDNFNKLHATQLSTNK